MIDFSDIFDEPAEAETVTAFPNPLPPTPPTQQVTIFDIETGGLPTLHLDKIRPPFDRESFTHKSWGAEAIERHRDKLEREYVETFADKAALSPLTGQVLAIGIYANRADATRERANPSTEDECDLLDWFWSFFSHARDERRKLVGFNIAEFDVPFLIRRSWLLGVPVPPGVIDSRGYLSPVFVDLYRVWKCGCRFGDSGPLDSKLDTLARCFGLPPKLDGLSGGDFAKLWAGSEADKKKARAYLLRDLEITYELARRMGVAP